MNESATSRPASRRSFLDAALGVGAVVWLGTVLYPVVRFLKPLPQQGPGGPTRLTPDEVSKLDKDSMVIVPVAGARVIVFEADGEPQALAARCTHEGCTVQWVPAESVIWCACHNAKFDAQGRVLSGPPPRPLPRYRVQRDNDGNVIISAETV